MRNFYPLSFLCAAALSFSLAANAQVQKDPGEYMSVIGNQNQEISKNYLSYTSTVAHSKSARKAEARRKELIQSVKDATKKISALPPFKGDKSYRDSTVAFLKLTYHILNDDYAKIVNMEEVAEQSYDGMEAYLLAQDLANEKSNRSAERLQVTLKKFADANGVKLLEDTDDIGKKMELTGKVSNYHRVIYLLFFKSYKQEAYLMDAFKKKDINGIEQNNSTLLKYATAASAKLDTMRAFKNDRSLILACKQAQEFFKAETKETAAMVEFLIKEENFNKIKKSFDLKKPASRTKEDIDQYNAATDDLNKALVAYNNVNTKLNNSRNKSLDTWNKQSQAFLAKHTPHYK